MARNGPSSRRSLYGFKQSRQAGVPFTASKSPSKIRLEALLRNKPQLLEEVSQLQAEGRRSDYILRILQERGLDGRYWLGYAQSAEDEWEGDGYYDDSLEYLRTYLEAYQSVGCYATIMEFKPEIDDWVVLEGSCLDAIQGE